MLWWKEGKLKAEPIFKWREITIKHKKQIGTLVNITWKKEFVDNMNNVEKRKNGLIIQLER